MEGWIEKKEKKKKRRERDMGEQPVGGAIIPYSAFTPASLAVKNPLAIQETWVQSLYRDDPLEKEMATHSSILAWGIS